MRRRDAAAESGPDAGARRVSADRYVGESTLGGGVEDLPSETSRRRPLCCAVSASELSSKPPLSRSRRLVRRSPMPPLVSVSVETSQAGADCKLGSECPESWR